MTYADIPRTLTSGCTGIHVQIASCTAVGGEDLILSVETATVPNAPGESSRIGREDGVGMRAEVTKRWTFDAAHHLPDHSGKCRQPHGHTYTVEVSVEGPVHPARGFSDDGMVVDFGELSDVWKAHVEPLLDHRDLNETVGSRGCWPTTAENIARWIAESFTEHGVAVSQVAVWETPSSRAVVRRGAHA